MSKPYGCVCDPGQRSTACSAHNVLKEEPMSTPSKPSPGPWGWGECDDQDLVNEDKLCQHNGSPIGFYDESGLRGDPTHEANRALIAKAPEMLDMLKELAAWEVCPVCGNGPHHERCRLAALLRELP